MLAAENDTIIEGDSCAALGAPDLPGFGSRSAAATDPERTCDAPLRVGSVRLTRGDHVAEVGRCGILVDDPTPLDAQQLHTVVEVPP